MPHFYADEHSSGRALRALCDPTFCACIAEPWYSRAVSNDLIAVIKQKQTAIAKLQAELDEARALLTGGTSEKPRARVREWAESPTPRPAAPKRRKRAARRRSRATFTPKGEIVPTSSVGRTVTVLKRVGKPVHVDEIIKQIQADGHKVNKNTLVGNLSRYVKAGRVFYRAAPSVFGLLEMKKGA